MCYKKAKKFMFQMKVCFKKKKIVKDWKKMSHINIH